MLTVIEWRKLHCFDYPPPTLAEKMQTIEGLSVNLSDVRPESIGDHNGEEKENG